TVATILIGATAALYLAPGVAISNPTQAVAATDAFSDPAPQRFEVAQAQTGGSSTLPGGASSLNEVYRDWRVGCVQQGTTKRCAMSQIQAQQNGQRVLA
ncbi:invasion protein, partial [Phyllobacterium phragmitis]